MLTAKLVINKPHLADNAQSPRATFLHVATMVKKRERLTRRQPKVGLRAGQLTVGPTYVTWLILLHMQFVVHCETQSGMEVQTMDRIASQSPGYLLLTIVLPLSLNEWDNKHEISKIPHPPPSPTRLP